MKHGRLIIAALVGAMLITSLAGCGSKGTNDGESGEYQKINLSMAVNGTDTQIDSLVARHFADLVSGREHRDRRVLKRYTGGWQQHQGC